MKNFNSIVSRGMKTWNPCHLKLWFIALWNWHLLLMNDTARGRLLRRIIADDVSKLSSPHPPLGKAPVFVPPTFCSPSPPPPSLAHNLNYLLFKMWTNPLTELGKNGSFCDIAFSHRQGSLILKCSLELKTNVEIINGLNIYHLQFVKTIFTTWKLFPTHYPWTPKGRSV